ncbi:MAG: sugar ABC transporter permease [Lachnospiraceae bacterium]|nr:sugar ABC transporter permease [Lachnospiraceae bacterium]
MNNKKKTVEYGKYGYLFLAPFFIVFLIFQFYPLLYTFYSSFFYKEATGRGNATVVFGLGNYTNYVFGDKANGEIFSAIAITIILWLLNFIPQILMSLLLAAWFTDLQCKLRGEGAYKVIMYMPNIITAATIAVLFFNLFDVHGGVTYLLKVLHIVTEDQAKNLLTQGWFSLGLIAFIQFWMWYGNTMIVLIAGIMGISPSLYEAAMVDGASPRQQFFYITLPLLKPILQFTLVTSAIGGLQMYDIPQLFNLGKPLVEFHGKKVLSTQTVVMLIKQFAAETTAKDHGRAAAYSVILFFITLAVSMVFYVATSEKKPKKESK